MKTKTFIQKTRAHFNKERGYVVLANPVVIPSLTDEDGVEHSITAVHILNESWFQFVTTKGVLADVESLDLDSVWDRIEQTNPKETCCILYEYNPGTDTNEITGVWKSRTALDNHIDTRFRSELNKNMVYFKGLGYNTIDEVIADLKEGQSGSMRKCFGKDSDCVYVEMSATSRTVDMFHCHYEITEYIR